MEDKRGDGGGGSRDTDSFPSGSDGGLSLGVGEELGGSSLSGSTTAREVGGLGHVEEAVVPDLLGVVPADTVDVDVGLLLGVGASLSEEGEGEVGDTAVGVDTTVVEEASVASGVPVVRGVIEGRVVHEAEGLASKVAVVADHPAVGVLTTFDHADSRHTHGISPTLVEGTAVAPVAEVGSGLDNSVGEFVADDRGVTSKVREGDAVSVSVDHLLSVPEGVVVVLVVVDGGEDIRAVAVPGVAAKVVEVEGVADASVVVGLVDEVIRAVGAALDLDDGSGEVLGVVSVEDGAVLDGVDVAELDDLLSSHD